MKLKDQTFFLTLILFIPMITFSQTQLGSDLIGESFEDQFGTAIALSDDGTIVAVGSIRNKEVATFAGHVRLYQWVNESWTQLGTDIDGMNSDDLLGTSVALSADGLVVACGAPENGAPSGYVVIREWDGTAWSPKGEILEGLSIGDKFGTSVALSSDGNRVAVGATHADDGGGNSGQVRVYDWQDNQWVQTGLPINGVAISDVSGGAVSLSADGNRLAIGSHENDETDTAAGQVRVFEWSDAEGWNQIGRALNGEATRDESGSTVVLSADGNRLAIGAPFNDGNGIWSGHVRVYEWLTNDWIQLGNDIDGEDELDRSGISLDMGLNGNRLVIGALNNGGNGSQAGHARVYEWMDNKWMQIGEDIDGDKAQDLMGWGAAISEDGQIVAVGAPINGSDFAENAGYVRVLSLRDLVSTSIRSTREQEVLQVYPNPAKNVLYLDLDLPDVDVVTLEIQHTNGQQLFQKIVPKNQLAELDISDLPSGFFTITVKGSIFSQVIKMVKL